MVTYKYPRTAHFPWSEGATSDDKILKTLNGFVGRRVIVTEKMDGENTSLYRDTTHARSMDGRHHSSRDWVKSFWSDFAHDIPENWRVCGENLFARHSIEYTDLPSYFMGFSMWNDDNVCLSWDSTMDWFFLLGITPVPVLYDGIFDEKLIQGLYDPVRDRATREGYVVRIADSFSYSDFGNKVAKYVRARHVTSNEHWMHSEIIKNGLRDGE